MKKAIEIFKSPTCFTMYRYGTFRLVNDADKLENNLLRWCAAVDEEEIVMFKAGIDKSENDC